MRDFGGGVEGGVYNPSRNVFANTKEPIINIRRYNKKERFPLLKDYYL